MEAPWQIAHCARLPGEASKSGLPAGPCNAIDLLEEAVARLGRGGMV